MSLLPPLRLSGRPYETSKDHSKWGVHRDRPLVLVGDLNRTQT